CCHLARVRKKDCVAARKFNDLRLGPLRHESLEVGVDHPILFGDHGVARFLFPGCDRRLRAKCFTCNRYLGDRMKRATGLGVSAAKSAANASGSTARKPSPTGSMSEAL